jgi:hypothetical protein
MSDPVTGTASGAVTGDNLAQVIAQAVAAAVTTSLNEVTAKINQMLQSVSENVKKQSANDDTNFEASVTGAYDVFDDLRRANVSRDRIAVYAELALKQVLQHNDQIFQRSMDHFGALPPIAPRSATGPGTSGA